MSIATQKDADAQETDLTHLAVVISDGALQELPLKTKAWFSPTAKQKVEEAQETEEASAAPAIAVGELQPAPS